MLITGAAGLFIYGPDHLTSQHQYQAPIFGHAFDVFGAMWTIYFTQMAIGRQDRIAGIGVALMSATGLETLQHFNLAYGKPDLLGDGLVAPLIGSALVLAVPLIHNLVRSPRWPILGDRPTLADLIQNRINFRN